MFSLNNSRVWCSSSGLRSLYLFESFVALPRGSVCWCSSPGLRSLYLGGFTVSYAGCTVAVPRRIYDRCTSLDLRSLDLRSLDLRSLYLDGSTVLAGLWSGWCSFSGLQPLFLFGFSVAVPRRV